MTRPRTARAVLLLLAAGTALAACSSSSPAPTGPPSLRVVYRVEDSAQQPPRVTTVVVDDAPPYRGRTRTLAGPPPGTTDLGGTATDEGHQYLLDADGRVRTVAAVAPGFSGTGSGLAVALPAGEHHGLVQSVGTARVAGRTCTEWLSRDPLDSGPLAPASAVDRTTSCVDADGLLLRDAWTLHGQLVRTRTAVSVGRGPSLAGPGLLSRRTPAPAPSTGPGEQVKVVPRAVLLQALAVPEPPAPQGLSPDRDAAVRQLDPDGQPGVEGGVLTWTDGRRLAVLRLERGLTHRIAPPTTGVLVHLDAARTARLTATSIGLRLSFGQGSFVVTVTADLPEAALLAWAASLPLS